MKLPTTIFAILYLVTMVSSVRENSWAKDSTSSLYVEDEASFQDDINEIDNTALLGQRREAPPSEGQGKRFKRSPKIFKKLKKLFAKKFVAGLAVGASSNRKTQPSSCKIIVYRTMNSPSAHSARPYRHGRGYGYNNARFHRG
ncbi:unnamed protein product [Cyprideis torosa]|uniref:Uncharacterized protein n=1 Tax=Cyprideis torosa TaxID=163714 RepID=A0A7R8ZKS6_9CRUS|nr:unnamed protein product [Cyprideis torosa]CAG0882219.1 unnamed protein product [Cyprideis torosa]